jgi:hypothetical protein
MMEEIANAGARMATEVAGRVGVPLHDGSRPKPPGTDPENAALRETGNHPAAVAFQPRRSLRWPDIETMLGADFELTRMRRFKYRMRLLSTLAVRRQLLDECAREPFAQALLCMRPRAFYPVMNHLLDRRLGAQARLAATLASVRIVAGWIPEPQRQGLLSQELTLMTLADGTRVTFGLNGVSFHEGLWQVGLIAPSGTRLYSLGFGFTDSRTILIANVQGPSLGVDGPALIRQATHSAHGMRPPHLLLHSLRLLATQWGVETLLGVDPRNHVKGRWNLRRSRLRFDYQAFWTEREAVRDTGGNWRLPLAVETRALADVPAKRRAMYRRRYEMLAQLEMAVASLSGNARIVATEAPGPGSDIEPARDQRWRDEAHPCDASAQAQATAIHTGTSTCA